MLKRLIKRLPLFGVLVGLREEISNMRMEIDITKSRMDISNDLFNQYQCERSTDSYNAVFDLANPLVSICVSTYNRGNVLVERSVRSLLAQDYTNIEIIVVGDCCTDNTSELLSQINDKRLRFVNLPERGNYPENPEWRWMVAGTSAVNHALKLANGDFITHLDDDDEHDPNRISKLLQFIKKTRADIVWHPFWREAVTGDWHLIGAEEFHYGQVTTSSVLYHNWFKGILWDPEAYHYREPGDWNRFRKFLYLGARAARYPYPLLRHYKEGNQNQP